MAKSRDAQKSEKKKPMKTAKEKKKEKQEKKKGELICVYHDAKMNLLPQS